MRYFIVPAALMLTACALPGVSGTSTVATATNPTQQSCASRGLTLDATGKQCVTPSPPQGAETTGSLPSQPITAGQPSPPPGQQMPMQPKASESRPQQPQLQQPPEQIQERRAGVSVPVEQDAVFRPASPQSSETAIEFAHFVRASGYRCDSISALAQRSGGFTLACNRSTFRYAIKDKDGHLVVTIE